MRQAGCWYYKVPMFTVSLLLGLFSNYVLAEESVVPDAIPGVVTVTAEELIDLAEKTPGLVIIDARVADDRTHGYIEGSISLPNTETSCATLARIVKKHDTPTVYYCNGIKCGRSVKSINIATGCGYTKIYWYRGGFEEWEKKGFPYVTNEK